MPIEDTVTPSVSQDRPWPVRIELTQDDLKNFPGTDYDMAQLLMHECGHLYVKSTPGLTDDDPVWRFDPASREWIPHQSNALRIEVSRIAKKVESFAKSYHADPAEGEDGATKAAADRAKLFKALKPYLMSAGRSSAIRVLLDMDDIHRPGSAWEDLTHHVAFQNGVKLDLRTGETSEIRAQDLTRFRLGCPLPTNLDRDVSDSHIIRTIRRVFTGREDLIPFLQEAFYYTLMGERTAKAFFWLQGPSNCGKSSVTAMLAALMGSYYQPMPYATIQKPDGESLRFAMGNFENKRVAVIDETTDGKAIGDDMVKAMTGGHPINYERKYQEQSSYIAKFALWVSSNHLPNFLNPDDALSNRLRLFQVNYVIPSSERNPDYKTPKFWRNRPSDLQDLFRWAWQGKAAFEANHLTLLPGTMQAANAENRRDNDWIGRAIETFAVPDENSMVPLTTIRRLIQHWRDREGMPGKIGTRNLKPRLSEMGYARTPDDQIKGLRLIIDPDEYHLERAPFPSVL